MSLEDVKTLLDIEDDSRDAILNLIIKNVENQLKGRIGKDDVPSELNYDVPSELNYIVTELAIVRYNRLGSEGMSTESVEGHSATYSQDDFAPYMFAIEKYIDDDDSKLRRGAIRAL